MLNLEKAKVFFTEWDAGKEDFTIQSSGSTGEAKAILLKREWMIWSAKNTASLLHPQINDKMYCCLPIEKVGGLMMLVRSKVWNLQIDVVDAIANPLLFEVDADIISLTPYQIFHVMANDKSRYHLNRFKEVIIGGGEISLGLETELKNFNVQTQLRHSYGMSETYSHIALRNINGTASSDYFTPFSDIIVSADAEGLAMISLPFQDDVLMSNDIIQLTEYSNFKVLGRKDFIINSGGVKLMPERIEEMILQYIKPQKKFLISSVHDEILGNKLVLVTEDSLEFSNKDFSFLKNYNNYAIPKEIIQVENIPLNSGDKIDRLRVKENINR